MSRSSRCYPLALSGALDAVKRVLAANDGPLHESEIVGRLLDVGYRWPTRSGIGSRDTDVVTRPKVKRALAQLSQHYEVRHLAPDRPGWWEVVER